MITVLRRAPASIAATRSSAIPAPNSSGRRRSGPCLAGERERQRIQPGADVDGRDAPDRRDGRLLDSGRRRDKELLPHLPNGHQVVLAELGHTTDFWSYEPKASTRLLNAFLDSRPGRRLAVHASSGRLHARRDAHRARQGHRRRDDGLAVHRAPVSAADVAPRAQARRLRAQGERRAPVRVPAGARPRRMVHRRC